MRFSAEWWAFWAGVWAVALTAAAAIAGIVAWYFSNGAADATEARTRALELNVANANESAAKAQERAAIAERDLTALKNKLAPRQISDAQKTVLLARLKGSTARGNICLLSFIGDGEALAYRTQLERIFSEAGWPMVIINEAQLGGNTGSPSGIALAVRNPPNPPESAKVLAEAFDEAGIPVRTVLDMKLGLDTIGVLVFHKNQ